MSGNTFGTLFRITTFGESHGGMIGVVIDGCPPGMSLTEEDIQPELDRRRPGQSEITTQRKEEDTIRIVSGVFEGKTTGTPLTLLALNKDAKSEDYEALKNVYRPSHADYTYEKKYGIRDWRGGGRASARETLARVAAGAVAGKYLREKFSIEALSFVQQVGPVCATADIEKLTKAMIDETPVRCPDKNAAKEMIKFIQMLSSEGDSAGGVIYGIIRGVPAGLGEPVFDKLHADLGKAMLSINAVKGFEIGSGFRAADLRGSEHNDAFSSSKGSIGTSTNNAGGILGGISSGEPILFRVAFKPPSTIKKDQKSVDTSGNEIAMSGTGRHDPCVLPRAVPVVDAMANLVIMDHLLRHRGQTGSGN